MLASWPRVLLSSRNWQLTFSALWESEKRRPSGPGLARDVVRREISPADGKSPAGHEEWDTGSGQEISRSWGACVCGLRYENLSSDWTLATVFSSDETILIFSKSTDREINWQKLQFIWSDLVELLFISSENTLQFFKYKSGSDIGSY